jgi:hypothetical protein
MKRAPCALSFQMQPVSSRHRFNSCTSTEMWYAALRVSRTPTFIWNMRKSSVANSGASSSSSASPCGGTSPSAIGSWRDNCGGVPAQPVQTPKAKSPVLEASRQP